jgi:hypothetical protein
MCVTGTDTGSFQILENRFILRRCLSGANFKNNFPLPKKKRTQFPELRTKNKRRGDNAVLGVSLGPMPPATMLHD